MTDIDDIMKRHNSVGRPAAFAAWADALPRGRGQEFWSAVVQHWSGFDAIDHSRFAKLFRRLRSSRPTDMVAHLPDRIRVYRGQDAFRLFGLAWTTDQTVADGFAHGHRGIMHDDPVVYEMTISRADVAFSCDDRSESEIVIFTMTRDMIRAAMTGEAA